MKELRPFTDYFIEESIKKMSLAKVLDSDINKACSIIHNEAVSISPETNHANDNQSIEQECFLTVYPSKIDSEEYLAKSEQLVQSLHGINRKATYEIRGNKDGIVAGFYSSESNIQIIDSAIKTFYPNCFTEINESINLSGDLFVYSLIPQAEFWHAHTSPNILNISPLNSLVKTFASIKTGIGIFQVDFHSLPGQYHDLVEQAVDAEWLAKHGSDSKVTPSINSGSASRKLEYKSPDFKSYFAVCIRLILPDNALFGSVKAFISSYVYGPEPYEALDNAKFTKRQINEMANERKSFHNGFLLNAHELTSLVHIPYQILADKELEDVFEFRPAGDKPNEVLTYNDVEIGKWACGNSLISINLPTQREIPNVHIPGLPRSGKSILMGSISVKKLKNGQASFVFDPHGELVQQILRMIPKELIDKVIVIDFSLKGFTPQLTIRDNVDITNPSKVSDDLSESMKVVGANRERFTGPRMMYVLQCIYFIYSVVHEMDFTHLKLLISKSKNGKAFRTKIKPLIKHPIVLDFLDEIEFMTQESLMPVITIISHLLLDEGSLRLFTQNENRISINDIMENGKLCLVNLGVGLIGKQRSSILSGLVDSLITNNALARQSIPYELRKPCTILKDEFYLGPGDLDFQLTSLSKYNLSVMFAHQYLDQVEGNTREVMATAGTRIAFKLRRKDAENMGKDFGIDPKEFTSLKKFQAIMKVEDEVLKINTPRPIFPKIDYSEQIINNCIERYYLKHDEENLLKQEMRLSYDTL